MGKTEYMHSRPFYEKLLHQKSIINHVTRVKFRGREILAVQKSKNGCNFTIVPGYIFGYQTRVEKAEVGERIFSEVEVVPNSERSEIERVLKEYGFKGAVNF